MNKNNLSAFKRPAAKSVLKTAKDADAPSVSEKPVKPATQRLSKRAQIMFTETEYEKINQNRGAVPLSAYLRSRLKESGEI